MGQSAITGINLGVPAFQQNFVNASLSSGVLTVTHNLNSQYVSVTVFDENNLIIIPDDVDAVSTTQLTIDLTSYGDIGASNWRAIIVNTGANVNNIASDLNLSGQAAEDFPIFDGSNWVSKGGIEKIIVKALAAFDMTTATTTIAYTGFGFKPSYVHFLAGIGGTESASWGISDNVTELHTAFAGTNDDYQTSGGACIVLFTSPGNLQVATINSFDVDGFTLQWTKTGSPTGSAQVNVAAFR